MSPLAVDPYIAVEEFLTANNLPAWYMDEEESMTGDNIYQSHIDTDILHKFI